MAQEESKKDEKEKSEPWGSSDENLREERELTKNDNKKKKKG
jgi:hypothetical protein